MWRGRAGERAGLKKQLQAMEAKEEPVAEQGLPQPMPDETEPNLAAGRKAHPWEEFTSSHAEAKMIRERQRLVKAGPSQPVAVFGNRVRALQAIRM